MKYMPKIGEECECTYSAKAVWNECVVVPRGKVVLFLQDGPRVINRDCTFDFRPIKTERDKYMEMVADAICDASLEQLDEKSNVKRIAGIIFDAGLAK